METCEVLNPNSSFYMEKSKILILTHDFRQWWDRLRIYRVCEELSKCYTLDFAKFMR